MFHVEQLFKRIGDTLMNMNAAQLASSLRQFTGTETWFRHEIFRMFTYTEGVHFLATEAGAYWLVDQREFCKWLCLLNDFIPPCLVATRESDEIHLF